MHRCPICGTLLDWIELECGSRVEDDCPRCGPRGYKQPDEQFRDEVIDVEDYDND